MVAFRSFTSNTDPKIKDFNSGFFDEDDAFLNAFHRAMQFETGGLYDPRKQECIDGTNRKMCGESGGKDDRGGNTKYGITQNSHPDLDIDSLTLDEAKLIYKKGYWDSVRASELPSKVGYIMFNIACASGPGVAAKSLQRVLGVSVDGKLGPITIAKANSFGDGLADALLVEQKRFYDAIGASSPSQQKFVRGWKLRADAFAAKQILEDIDRDAVQHIAFNGIIEENLA